MDLITPTGFNYQSKNRKVMLQVIIMATIFITGLFAPKEPVHQTASSNEEICLATNGEAKKTNFHSKQNTHLFRAHTNLKNENERETI